MFYCAVVERTTDRQPHTSSGATSSEDEFTPVSEFGKRQEKAIQCQAEMCMVNTTDSRITKPVQQQGKVLHSFILLF